MVMGYKGKGLIGIINPGKKKANTFEAARVQTCDVQPHTFSPLTTTQHAPHSCPYHIFFLLILC